MTISLINYRRILSATASLVSLVQFAFSAPLTFLPPEEVFIPDHYIEAAGPSQLGHLVAMNYNANITNWFDLNQQYQITQTSSFTIDPTDFPIYTFGVPWRNSNGSLNYYYHVLKSVTYGMYAYSEAIFDTDDELVLDYYHRLCTAYEPPMTCFITEEKTLSYVPDSSGGIAAKLVWNQFTNDPTLNITYSVKDARCGLNKNYTPPYPGFSLTGSAMAVGDTLATGPLILKGEAGKVVQIHSNAVIGVSDFWISGDSETPAVVACGLDNGMEVMLYDHPTNGLVGWTRKNNIVTQQVIGGTHEVLENAAWFDSSGGFHVIRFTSNMAPGDRAISIYRSPGGVWTQINFQDLIGAIYISKVFVERWNFDHPQIAVLARKSGTPDPTEAIYFLRFDDGEWDMQEIAPPQPANHYRMISVGRTAHRQAVVCWTENTPIPQVFVRQSEQLTGADSKTWSLYY